MESLSRPVCAICWRISTTYQLKLSPRFPGSRFRVTGLAAMESWHKYRIPNFGMTYKYFIPAIYNYRKSE